MSTDEKPIPGFEHCWGDQGVHAPRCVTCPMLVPESAGGLTMGGGNACARDPQWKEIGNPANHFCGSHPFHMANANKIATIALQRSFAADQQQPRIVKPGGLIQ